ncbi:MAG: cell surface protein SprA, partial [Flavobacteriales bacterium]|nr:cell surface protein SprA [Flavobacteriales bacterium]
RIEMSQNALNPDNVGGNFISDVRTATVSTEDGRKRVVNWYQFRIPVRTPNKTKHGDIRDFRSIRFIRMYMKGFTDPVHLRMARLELVRGEWRKYQGEIDDNPEGITQDQEVAFNVGAVNLEENSGKLPVNYVIPPGIQRETNVNTTSLQQINEQALQLKVCGLEDGTAQAAYRNTQLDLRMYGTLKMFVHAETLAEEAPIQDDELTVFIRLGTDFQNHYYEYEIPVKVTPPGVYSSDYEPSQLQVWPELNNMEISLKGLTNLKLERDRQILNGESDQLLKKRYWKDAGQGKMFVVGNPNLGEVKTIMVGIRNPRKVPTSVNDDGLSKCAEVWVNELRLSDFDQTNGWATVGQANLKMADLANVVVTAGMSTPGWGSLEKKVAERQKETKKNAGITAAINLDKVLPEKWGVKVPMYTSYSADIEEPQFSPLAPDIQFKDYLEAWDTKAEKDSVKKITTDRVIRKSLNFTNVRKERTGDAKPTPIDISNFSVSYAQTSENHTDFETSRDFTRTQKGSLTYNYGLSPKPIKPLSKVKLLRESDYLQLAREMNFYLLPKSFAFTTSMDRMYNAFQMRNNNPGLTARLPAFYNKSFTWTRTYNFKYDITKNLSFDFNASNRALLEEPEGPAERAINDEGQWDAWKKEMWDQIQELGTNMSYTHTGNFNYTIPLNYIPALDWINSSLGYGSSYTWTRAPLGREEFGAVIQNSNTFTSNANLNLKRLYSKSKYLQGVGQRARRHQQEKARGKQDKKKPELEENADGEKAEEKKPKDKNAYTFTDRASNFLMSITTASINYTRGKGTLIPGYNQTSTLLGMNPSLTAPGWGFISGQQADFDGEDKFWV